MTAGAGQVWIFCHAREAVHRDADKTREQAAEQDEAGCLAEQRKRQENPKFNPPMPHRTPKKQVQPSVACGTAARNPRRSGTTKMATPSGAISQEKMPLTSQPLSHATFDLADREIKTACGKAADGVKGNSEWDHS